MANTKGQKVPAAPYPPMAATGTAARSRSRSFSHSANNKNKPINSPSQSSRSSAIKRQLSSRVQFYTSDIYGGVNVHSATDSIKESSILSPPESSATGTSPAIRDSLNRDRGLMHGIKKLGPVLLDLRCLQTFGCSLDVDEDKLTDYQKHFKNGTRMRNKRFAVSRGISTLGANVSSTCLSFRKNYDVYGNVMNDVVGDTIQAATGLTTGALCIHTLRNVNNYIPPSSGEVEDEDIVKQWTTLDSAKSEDASVSYFSHYQPRHHRHASSVAWRPGPNNARFVAIGLLGSSVADRSGTMSGGDSFRASTLQRSGTDVYPSAFNSSKDRDYCALVWDIEASSKGQKQVPIIKLAHNAGVASLAWMTDGQLLAVGCTQRNVQIYDLRLQGTSSPPLSAGAHENAVHGIEVDPSSQYSFATFSRGLAEPVKLWDLRRMDSCVSEIKLYSSTKRTGAGITSNDLTNVSAVAWDTSERGVLSIAINDSLRFYDTRINPSRPTLTRMTHSHNPIQSIAFQPQRQIDLSGNASSTLSAQRMLVVENDGSVKDLPLHQVAPVAISFRDGRVANAIGGAEAWVGETIEGPAAMESTKFDIHEDISKVMMRRARCLHVARYSTDASSNLQMISMELESIHKETSNVVDYNDILNATISRRKQLRRLWSWIERVERLCGRKDNDSMIDERRLPARGLQDAGLLRLLRIDSTSNDEVTAFDRSTMSPIFNRNTFDSPMRRAALTGCGWVGKFGMEEVLSNIESQGNFERSAALAVWDSNIREAVSALQRGAENYRVNAMKDEDNTVDSKNMQYAETLELVAMCIAGYSSGNKADTGSVWRSACESLLRRSDLTIGKSSAYLRAICLFLINVSEEDGLKVTLSDEKLSLSDRCAFATIFLSRIDLKEFLEKKVSMCIESGNLEGILITGLDKMGIALLQSYVDKFSDVQSAALISSRVIVPSSWTKERMICSEWLETYRDILNKWQMWQSRALFDVGRVELLRKLRERQHQAEEQMVPAFIPVKNIRRVSAQHNRRQAAAVAVAGRQSDSERGLIQEFPPQMHARCNYCNTALPLSKLIRRQDGIANNWLSRQNPVLSCCPNSQCRKPLPRCAICLLPLGCLNPYLELRKHGLQNVDDLSELASLPFAEWFTWCMRCKHGGHSHHMVGWFSEHDTCPVSNCDCKCEFDGIRKLKRVGLAKPKDVD